MAVSQGMSYTSREHYKHGRDLNASLCKVEQEDENVIGMHVYNVKVGKNLRGIFMVTVTQCVIDIKRITKYVTTVKCTE